VKLIDLINIFKSYLVMLLTCLIMRSKKVRILFLILNLVTLHLTNSIES